MLEAAIGLLLVLGTYLLGSVSPSYLLVRFRTGEDVRQSRSRNAGTLNTYHRLGLAGGVTVLVLDAGKGALAVLAPAWVNAPEWTVYATAPLVLIGHNWPVFLRFRGGKGAAVLLGVSLGLFPVATAICLVPVVVIMVLFRNVVLGAAIGYVLVCLTLIFLQSEWSMVALSIFLAVLAGVTYLYGFRGKIAKMARVGDWRRLMFLRFVD